MAGGSGSRLWPLSRDLHPKQFLKLTGNESMLQATVLRVRDLPAAAPLVICNEEHRFLAAEQLRELNVLQHNVLLEPTSRNTSAAIALAAIHALKDGADPLLLVLAADHVILDEAAFHASVLKAIPLAKNDRLVTFGIVTGHPETGYGYICKGRELAGGGFDVAAFIEKPNLVDAESYHAHEDFFWNSGMFLFRASVYLAELERYRPQILAACEEAMLNPQSDLDFIRVNAQAFAACPSESVDYAVMENTEQAVVMPIDAGWSDVGAFSSLWKLLPKDANGNVVRGDVLTHDSHNNLLFSENALIATVGVQDLVVIQTKDAVLVASRERVQEVKEIVAQLKAQDRNEQRLHRQVFRPWGNYDCIDEAGRYKVKRISVLPGAKLSLQMHHHRAEHWVVVSGTAVVSLNGKEQILTENESVYLPLGAVHSLENPGKIVLELIEVQVGSYLGEDDIIRFKDLYGRTNEITPRNNPWPHETDRIKDGQQSS
jgi:mannose-1-phosphate guanylyltransferase